MIDYDVITNLSKKYQTAIENVMREYCQHLFLSYLYQQPESNKLYFKGGTALRIIYGSPRFSEDLDFSALLYSHHIIEQIIIQTLSEIEREGIETILDEATSTTGGYLAIMRFIVSGKTITTKIEVSQRKGGKQGELVTIINDFISPYTITQLSQDQLVGEKIAALLGRKKPRDFYDLYFLLRANMITVQQKKMFLPEALAVLQKARIRFDQELKEFLPKSHRMVIREFPKALEKEIKRHL